MILRDVMNSKSSFFNRQSVDDSDIKYLSKFYAIESRHYNAIYNQERGIYIKGSLWFMNELVFDFDYDEEHCDKSIKNYEDYLNKSLKKLESLLGTPKYIITNKNEYNNYQINKFFTKIDNDGNKIVKLPKKYGCQVVYELKESIKSQRLEEINLFNKTRLYISNLIDADMNFKGHMFKNYFNRDLFNIIYNENYNNVDIFDIAQKFHLYSKETVDMIRNLKDFEDFNSKNKPHKNFLYFSNKLFNYYWNLNLWRKNYNSTYSNSNLLNSNLSSIKTTSRNETLFNYFRQLTYNDVLSINYDICNNIELFSNCDIKDPLTKFEFQSVKNSVLNYKEKYGDIESIKEINNDIDFIDPRVFKIDFCKFNVNFFSKNRIKFENSLKHLYYYRNSNRKFIKIQTSQNKIFNYDLYNKDFQNKSCLLSDYFSIIGIDFTLSNIKNLITPDFINFIKNNLLYDCNNLILYNIYKIIQNAIYYTHFKYHNTIIKKYKNSVIVKDKNGYKINKHSRIKRYSILKRNGFLYNRGSNILGFKKYYDKLKNNGLIKDNGNAYPVSFYQSKFNVSCSYATILSRLIKRYFRKITSVVSNNINNNFIMYNDNIKIFINKIVLINYYKIHYYNTS